VLGLALLNPQPSLVWFRVNLEAALIILWVDVIGRFEYLINPLTETCLLALRLLLSLGMLLLQATLALTQSVAVPLLVLVESVLLYFQHVSTVFYFINNSFLSYNSTFIVVRLVDHGGY